MANIKSIDLWNSIMLHQQVVFYKSALQKANMLYVTGKIITWKQQTQKDSPIHPCQNQISIHYTSSFIENVNLLLERCKRSEIIYRLLCSSSRKTEIKNQTWLCESTSVLVLFSVNRGFSFKLPNYSRFVLSSLSS